MDTLPAAKAVEALIHEYYKLVFHTIYGLTNDWEESQDLTQETFYQALKGIDAARNTSGTQFHAKAWLLRIALNAVRMQRRRRNIFRFIPFSRLHEGQQVTEHESEAVNEQAAPVQPAGYGATDTGDVAETIAERDMVQRTMANLPEVMRECLLLSIVGGLSSNEIAALLDLKEPTVRQRLARARKLFQQAYARESGAELFDQAIDNTRASRQRNDKDHVWKSTLSAPRHV